VKEAQHITQRVKEKYDHDLFGYKGVFSFLTFPAEIRKIQKHKKQDKEDKQIFCKLRYNTR
jgi:hypothetical protein